MADGGGAPQEWDGGGTLTVLVVEDDAAVAALLREVLNDVPGWGATVVHDAAAARAAGRVVRVEALVLDQHLPGISGLELLALWAADPAWPAPPVVLTTADPEHAAVRAAVVAGRVAALVPKPFDVDDLVAAVRRVAAAPA
jgi:two-component system chemotaxis response regulator CheY